MDNDFECKLARINLIGGLLVRHWWGGVEAHMPKLRNPVRKLIYHHGTWCFAAGMVKGNEVPSERKVRKSPTAKRRGS